MKKIVSGTKAVFAGMKKPQEREDIVARLATLAPPAEQEAMLSEDTPSEPDTPLMAAIRVSQARTVDLAAVLLRSETAANAQYLAAGPPFPWLPEPDLLAHHDPLKPGLAPTPLRPMLRLTSGCPVTG